MASVRKDILNGWKEIAGYVSRDIRTVERWEKYRGMPVRRMPGAGRATVYAVMSEVDEWLAGARIDETEDQSAEPAGLPEGPLSLSLPDLKPNDPSETASPNPTALRRGWALATSATAATVLLLVIAWPMMVQARRGASAEKSVHPSEVSGPRVSGVAYRSRVPGVDELYLSGIYSYEQRTPQSLKQSLRDFNDAIGKDPGYAPAYAGMSNTYNLLREYSGMADAEAFSKAKVAAQRAIALDPSLPQAHASLGFIEFFWSWDAVSAEKEFKTALELDPNSVLAHHWYGSMLAHQGRFSESLEQLTIAQRLEPTSAAILSLRAMALGLGGHRDEAVAGLEQVLKEAPSANSPHNILGMLSLVEPRDIPRYLAETRRVAELRNDAEWLRMADAAGRAYRSGDEKAMWASVIDFYAPTAKKPYVVAQAEAELGHPDKAISILQALIDDHNAAAMGMHNDPVLVSLHTDPRFAEMLRRIGCPPAADARP